MKEISMQENKPDNSDIKPAIHNSPENENKKKVFKKKKFNGHLRNNQKKEKSFHNDSNKEVYHMQDDEPEVISTTTKPIYNELFYLLRQRFSYNKVAFFQQLENVLSNISFKDIREGDMTLFSYSCLYEKNEIFIDLCEKFSKEIIVSDFENYIIPTCLNKNEEILNNAIDNFDKHVQISKPFIQNLISKMTKTSYRELNNNIILNWIVKHFDDELKFVFWESAFTEKNISLINTALTNNLLKDYLRQNFNKFAEIIDKMGKKIEITNKLSISTEQNVTVKSISTESQPVLNIAEESKTYLSNAEEQLQNLRKEEVDTKIVIKRRKIVA